VIFNINFKEKILNLFDEFHFAKKKFSLILLTLILGVTIGVLVLMWFKKYISARIQQHTRHKYASPLGIIQDFSGWD